MLWLLSALQNQQERSPGAASSELHTWWGLNYQMLLHLSYTHGEDWITRCCFIWAAHMVRTELPGAASSELHTWWGLNYQVLLHLSCTHGEDTRCCFSWAAHMVRTELPGAASSELHTWWGLNYQVLLHLSCTHGEDWITRCCFIWAAHMVRTPGAASSELHTWWGLNYQVLLHLSCTHGEDWITRCCFIWAAHIVRSLMIIMQLEKQFRLAKVKTSWSGQWVLRMDGHIFNRVHRTTQDDKPTQLKEWQAMKRSADRNASLFVSTASVG